MFAQIAFIVWRESVEALLVIGILHAWSGHNGVGTPVRRYLWAGVASGLLAAIGLAFALIELAHIFTGDGLAYFQIALVGIATILIVQMVVWMRRHGRNLRRELEGGMAKAAENSHWWAVFALAMLAVAREGSEAVVFLYGILSTNSVPAMTSNIAAAVVGLVLAMVSYGLLQLCSRYLSWRVFFKLTEIMLLCLGCALFVSAIGQLVGLGLLPYSDPLWDSSWLLSDSGRLGGVIAALTGYRAMPDKVIVASWIVYWLAIFIIIKWPDFNKITPNPVKGNNS